MKNKLNNLFYTILFSWIIISGTVYTSTKCLDQGFCPCDQASFLGSNTATSISICAYNSQYSTVFSFAAGKKDFCCKDKTYESEEKVFLRTQNSNFQKQFVNFVHTSPGPLNKERALGPIFDHHETIQTISIYTINQSFLC